MNLLVLMPEDFIAPDRVLLEGRRHIHLAEILKCAHGDELRVGVLNGMIGTGSVTAAGAGFTELEVFLGAPPPPPLDLNLVIAMPRPKVFRRIIAAATAMGIKNIDVIRTWRVEKSYLESPVLEPDAIRGECILGLEQARDTVMPRVTLHPLFRPFVEDVLPGICRGTLALAAHPVSSTECPRLPGRPVTLAIGPEGGFIDFEISLLENAGFIPVSIGERILRVETALPALVGRLT